MENRLRDLEQIQEKDIDESARRMGLILLASIAVLAVIFSIGVVVGSGSKSNHRYTDDPLARIESLNLLTAQYKDKSPISSRVRAEDLSFPSVLTQKQDPPEVAAAVAAAAAEEAELNAELSRFSDPVQDKDVSVLEPPGGSQTISSSASKISSERRLVSDRSKVDLGVSVRKPALREMVPAGREGEFNIQVMSYESREPAIAFAKGLRARGHRAFVVNAKIPDRGTYWRVRIGPFESKWQAEQYRRKFEQEEHLNVIVVRNKR